MESTQSQARPDGQFPVTPWTMLMAAGGDNTMAFQALGDICQLYWYPLFAFVRRSGIKAQDAEDITQGFFQHFFTSGRLETADRAKGRLRSFLLGALKYYMANERRNDSTQKRGGDVDIVSLEVDFEGAEQRYQKEPAVTLSPDLLYDQQWTLVLLERVLKELGTEYERKGKKILFEKLSGFIAHGGAEPNYEVLSEEIGMTVNNLRVNAHRLRQRYRDLLHREVAATVDDPEDTVAELGHLMNAFA